tara:strand:- start:231 stop:419 length:189 start_codon:yes stop_codon:yes gene_type:complete
MGVLKERVSMGLVSSMLYLIIFYVSLCLFLWNFNTFTFQEKVIAGLVISGFQCISAICDKKN